MSDRITIVNKKDEVIGSEERSIVYQKGLIHRLIRVVLINNKNQILLQWRSAQEDTFPNTWDQSAGGHVDAGEDYEVAAYRELDEELGVKEVELKEIQKFYTEGEIGNKIIKRFNKVFIAKYNKDDFVLQSDEVEKVKWFEIAELFDLIKKEPEKFTHGLVTVLNENKDKLLKLLQHKL